MVQWPTSHNHITVYRQATPLRTASGTDVTSCINAYRSVGSLRSCFGDYCQQDGSDAAGRHGSLHFATALAGTHVLWRGGA
jgi:hypothetical protein